VTAEFRRRDRVHVLGVEIVAVTGQQKLEVERRESRQSRLVKVFVGDSCFSLGEEFVVVLPENRPVRRDRFEAFSMKMMSQFACELVESIEVAVEVIAAVVRADETTVAKPLENSVDCVAVVVAPVGDLGDRPRLVDVVQHLECLAGQQLGEVDVGFVHGLPNDSRPHLAHICFSSV
jgi:hypothetical protein